ncbi:MAG: MmcQ/YjbR family DNA-binding protein [Acidobacteriota bacterium]
MTKAAAEKHIRRVRQICLAFPGVLEKLSHCEPTFFTPKRVFAMISNNHHDDGHVAVLLPCAPGVQADLIAERPETFYYPKYVGIGGWVGVELDQIGEDDLGAQISEAYRFITSKPKTSAKKPRSAR